MSDLVERLLKKWPVDNMKRFGYVNPDGPEAAEALTAKDADIARMREALEAAEELHMTGLFNATGGQIERVNDLRRQALATDQIETSGFADCEASHGA